MNDDRDQRLDAEDAEVRGAITVWGGYLLVGLGALLTGAGLTLLVLWLFR